VERGIVSSPTQGAWVCRHNVDGRDYCPECYGPPDGKVCLGCSADAGREIRHEPGLGHCEIQELHRIMAGNRSDDWIVRSLRAIHDEPGYDIDAAIERFHAAVRRMETDPEYAAHIRAIADEVDADLAAEEMGIWGPCLGGNHRDCAVPGCICTSPGFHAGPHERRSDDGAGTPADPGREPDLLPDGGRGGDRDGPQAVSLGDPGPDL
jgi:hypothetical protein